MNNILFISILAFLPFAYAQEHTDLARLPGEQQVIKRTNYALSYNDSHKVANWVAYSLRTDQLKSCVTRPSGFVPDPLITTGTAVTTDYTNTGFDRGHLLPAGDMKYDAKAMKDTFFMSNVTPQPPTFNRGMWARMEVLVRAWTKSAGKMWIVTGPVLTETLPWIGHRVTISVPKHFYKVMIRKVGNKYVGMAILMSTDLPHATLIEYATTINAIEALTGIDFFPFLDDAVEEEVERATDMKLWDFKATFEYLPCSLSVAR